MNQEIIKISLKSIKHFRKQVVFQFLIVVLLCAVITGSLMTGKSVRESLKQTALGKIGNTGIFISSGLRYFDKELEDKFSEETGLSTTGFLELRGTSQALFSQKSANNTIIYAVQDDFFSFHNRDSIKIRPGEVIINTKLASLLDIKEGDDLIIRFRSISDIPGDAPFAPSEPESTSFVLKAGMIADPEQMGNFSLNISQIASANIFMNLADLEKLQGEKYKINRLLVERTEQSTGEITSSLKNAIAPSDAGLHLRSIKKTGEHEIISDRVFIDGILLDTILEKLPSSSPVITYLANKMVSNGRVNPYSFVSAIPSDLYPSTTARKGIIINNWLSEDLGATQGDSLMMIWYSPDSLNHLVERSSFFLIEEVRDMEGIWSDSQLMPDFPGISGSESCSNWDAGIPINTNLIREKDEDYWNRYKGTPKAFINYETGKELWGSNYGPATAVRFPAEVNPDQISEKLVGSIDPSILGFTVNDIYEISIKAAEESVDFGTLFLSLGFFLILAAFVLLSFAVSYYFDLKKDEVKILHSLGFRNNTISRLLMFEISLTALFACLAGGLLGYLVNIILTTALNTVWTGAVQTNTLITAFDIETIITGFSLTYLMIVIFIFFKTRNYLSRLQAKGSRQHAFPSLKTNLMLLITAGIITTGLFVLSLLSPSDRINVSFISGSMLLVTMVLFSRQFYLSGRSRISNLSRLYYAFHSSHAIAPVMFIAAGIFAVFITAVNRKNFDSARNDNSSGTGGYLLWMETSVPVSEDLNSQRGRASLGLDEEAIPVMNFVQMKRSEGNDASCLNLNHITAPPLLGADPGSFIEDEAFSFSGTIGDKPKGNPWELLEARIENDVIYGIADQTVLDWGLKIGIGDTLIVRAENGQPLKIIIAAGLQSSVFQGYVIISKQNFTRYYPSVPGNSVFLVDGLADSTGRYSNLLKERFQAYGPAVEVATDRLMDFYEITNTYLTVFGVFGGLGMITGIVGLGFVLLRNYHRRKREFALMLATGFTPRKIRKLIFSEQVLIIFAGMISGIMPATVATLPSILSNQGIPWLYLGAMILAIFLTGILAVAISSRSIHTNNLIASLRKD